MTGIEVLRLIDAGYTKEEIAALDVVSDEDNYKLDSKEDDKSDSKEDDKLDSKEDDKLDSKEDDKLDSKEDDIVNSLMDKIDKLNKKVEALQKINGKNAKFEGEKDKKSVDDIVREFIEQL